MWGRKISSTLISLFNKRRYRYESSVGLNRKRTFQKFFRLALAIGLAAALVFGTLGLIAFEYFRNKYQGIADSFNLEQVERMEAASIIYDRTGKEFGKIFIQNRNPISYEEFSPLLVDAVIAAEDGSFYTHKGVDWQGVMRAAITNYTSGRISQGASTVTQQLARNSFNMREKTFERKFIEMLLAMRIEKTYQKNQIMEMYLNRVYFGSGFYGAEAASRGYFGKSAKDINLGEAAMLAGLLRSPNGFSPWNNLEAATAVRNRVLLRMRETGKITREQYDTETESKLFVRKRSNPHKVSYAVDYIRQQVIAALGFERAANGGFHIYTTLDLGIQRVAESSLKAQLDEIEKRPDYKHETYADYRARHTALEDAVTRGHQDVKLPTPKYLQGAALVLDNATGAILSLIGGRDFKHSEYNRVTQSRRPSGTVFTPIVYAAAFEKGIFPGEIVQDACIDNRYVQVGGATGILGEWGVERAENEYSGDVTAREALVQGKNAATVRLGFRTGIESVKELASKLGITSKIRDYANSYLGSSEMTLEELTLAYTAFPGLGLRPEKTYIIQKIADPDGTVMYENTAKRVRALSADAAYQTNSALEDVLKRGTGDIAYTEAGLKVSPAAAKTGTAYNFTDTYCIGYTDAVTAGVWIGFDLPTRIYRGAFGRNLALPVWSSILNKTVEEFPAKPLPLPTTLRPVEICRTSGLLSTPKCFEKINGPHGEQEVKTTYIEYATEAQAPKVKCDVHGGGVRNYSQQFDQEEWPRAAAALDLTRIRPVAVSAPTLLGLNDVYRSIRPGIQRTEEEIPVAKALPVGDGDGFTSEDGIPRAEAVIPAGLPVAIGTEPEVRKAEAAAPVDSGFESPSIEMEKPKPAQF